MQGSGDRRPRHRPASHQSTQRDFLRSWREGLNVSAERHVDTFEEYGNLFGAAVPINVARASDRGLLKKGLPVALGGFSHAGDYAAAAIWIV